MKKADAIKEKIHPLQELKSLMHQWRLLSKSVVFTNGVFDILHRGHIAVLSEAAKLGDKLIVALNADASVKRLKGKDRPVNNEADRALIMASLVMVDAVVIFREDTPLELIKELKPDVLVKGGDYNEDTIAGAAEVKASGGKVVVIPLEEGYSTTETIKKMSQFS